MRPALIGPSLQGGRERERERERERVRPDGEGGGAQSLANLYFFTIAFIF